MWAGMGIIVLIFAVVFGIMMLGHQVSTELSSQTRAAPARIAP